MHHGMQGSPNHARTSASGGSFIYAWKTSRITHKCFKQSYEATKRFKYRTENYRYNSSRWPLKSKIDLKI